MKTEWVINTADDMERFGAKLAAAVAKGSVIFLQGDLGAGKTTLSRGFLRGLGYSGNVKSPTYTLVEPYQINERVIYHFDLYRIQDPEELAYMGIRDYFSEDAICLIEWAERCTASLPAADLICMIAFHQQARKVCLEANSAIGTTTLRCLQNEDC